MCGWIGAFREIREARHIQATGVALRSGAGGEVYGKVRLPCSYPTCGSTATRLLVPQVLPQTAGSAPGSRAETGSCVRTSQSPPVRSASLCHPEVLRVSWALLHSRLPSLERDPLLTNTYLASKKDSGKQGAQMNQDDRLTNHTPFL